MSLPDAAASIWVQVMRLAALDANGFVDPGAATYVTDKAVKVTFTPVTESGDAPTVKGASGNLVAFGKKGDIPKWATISLELGIPDVALEQLLCGGTLLGSTAMALGAPSGLTTVGQITLGSLAAGTYGYRASQYNVFGESLAESTVTTTVASGSSGLVVVSGLTFAGGASGARIYGRTQGIEQLLGVIPNIGSQATAASSGTGTVTSLTVTALTSSIPQGTKFQISGDTNTTKIVFTTTAFAPAGVTTLAVTASQSVTTTIVAAAIIPVFVDDGTVTPSGNLPTVDQTAGPGLATGYQAPKLGVVANPNGVSVECFSFAMVNGRQATDLPYWWWVFPCFANAKIMPRDLTNANAQTIVEGDGFANPNWGNGPGGATGNFPFDSSQYYQRIRCGSVAVPSASGQLVAAVG